MYLDDKNYDEIMKMGDIADIKSKLKKMQMQTNDPYYDAESEEVVNLLYAQKMTKDLLKQIKVSNGTMSREEIKTTVKLFYQMQSFRKATREQIRSIQESDNKAANKNVVLLDWVLKNSIVMEKGIENSLKAICESCTVGRWLLQITGIGPVLAAGLLGFYNVEGIKYATAFISYGGLIDNIRPWLGAEKSRQIVEEVMKQYNTKTLTEDCIIDIAAKTQWKYAYLQKAAFDQETGKWNKKNLINACAKVPYNMDLKTHLYKIGESFHWCMNKPQSLYGRLYAEKKISETRLNEEGAFAQQAEDILKKYNISKNTNAYEAYSQGMLSKAHINARASRYTQKIFVSHLFEEMYRVRYDKPPARFYSLEHCEGHHKDIKPEVPFTLTSEEKKLGVNREGFEDGIN